MRALSGLRVGLFAKEEHLGRPPPDYVLGVTKIVRGANTNKEEL